MLGSISRLASIAVVGGLAVAGLTLAGGGFMVMLPALLLIAPLLLGRYVGERRIERIRRSLAARRLRPTGRALPASALGGHAPLFRGGRLIATSMAVRPPPLFS